jgi:hypothetical protein
VCGISPRLQSSSGSGACKQANLHDCLSSSPFPFPAVRVPVPLPLSLSHTHTNTYTILRLMLCLPPLQAAGVQVGPSAQKGEGDARLAAA